MPDMVILETEERMEKAIAEFKYELSSLRTGAASASLLSHINVDYYGSPTPLTQIANVSVVEGTQLYVKPYDKTAMKDIEKAINMSDIGINPQSDGNGIRLVFPKMTEENRREIAKKVSKFGEACKIRVRNIRRDGNDSLKKLELSEDDLKGYTEDVQTLTNEKIKLVDTIIATKEKDIMTV